MKSIVSRVLNGETSVSSKSRQKVETVIREYNYIPNRNASMTKCNRRVILVLVTRLDSYSETRLVHGMMENACEGSEFIIMETQFDIEKTKKIIENNKSLCAVVIFVISGQKDDFLKDILVPVIIVGQELETNYNNLYFADYKSMFALVKAKKVKGALFIGYNENDNTMVKRYQGASDAVNEQLDYVPMCEYGKIKPLTASQAHGYQTFICATETIALQVYKSKLINNIKDYQILSVGNNKSINFVIDNYSAIDFHYKQAGTYLFDCMKNDKKIEHQSVYNLILNDE